MVTKLRLSYRLAPLLGLTLATAPILIAQAQPSNTALQETQQSMEAAAGDAVEITQSPVTGLATFVTAKPTNLIPTFAAPTASAEERGRQFLTTYGKAFGVSAPDQLQLQRAEAPDEVGIEHVRFRQLHNGVPVRGGEIITHLRGGNVTAVTAKTLPGLDAVDTKPTLTPDKALAAAQALLVKQLKVSDAKLSTPQLEIFNRGLLEGGQTSTHLAWFIEATKINVREQIWVDAKRGGILLHFSQITDSKSRAIYNTNNSSTLPGTLVRSEGGATTADNDVNKAYDYSGDTYDYYFTQHARDSYDGVGGILKSTTHYCPSAASCPYQNAFWNGVQMVYGEGFSAADDVDAHELTHAVTERSASLVYYMQSGALNESFSDIFGETVDLTNVGGTDTAAVRWLMGEDIPGIGAIRNMMNPNAFGDPGKVSDPQLICNYPGYDNGGVHINSGVPNHAYALMVDGGTYNGQTVTGIGLTKAGKIQYRVLTKYLVSTADFQADYSAIQQACTDLVGTVGITAADCTQVKKALDAVEMSSSTCSPANVPAFCPTGQTPTNVFFDDLENITSGKWAKTTATGLNHWDGCYGTPDVYCPGYPSSGDYFFWGYNLDSTADSAVAMTASVTIPSSASSPRLQFNHSFNFETSGTAYYDGGVVEYSTNGGSTWTDAGSLIAAGAAYGGAIYTGYGNPLAGKNAFVGGSLGYTASQLNLASLAGQSARFRFRMGTDDSVGDVGWFVDDVRIYSCAASPTVDFVVTNTVLTPASPAASSTFTAAVTVKNQGTSAGTVGTLQLWANQAASQACGAVGDKSATIGSLAAGASATVTITGIPAGAAGSKTLRTFVDSQCATAESNEANNQATQAYTVTSPDFVVSSVTLSPASPGTGSTFTAAVTVKNQGTSAGTVGTLQLWANQTASQACGAVGNKSATIGSLAAGASATVTITGIPAGAAGSKTLRTFVDSQCATVESNEANNQATQAYTVTGPDFVVSNITLSPTTPTVKGTFSATVTVKNQGTVSGNAGYLDVWVNQPTAQTCPADGNAFATVGTLAAGASKTITLTGLPAGAAGAKTLRAFVDSSCLTAETIDNNNQSTLAYTVSGGRPDFVVTSVTLNPAGPKAKTSFSATVVVKNQGTTAGDGGFLDVWANQPTAQTCPADGDNFAAVGVLAAGASKTLTVTSIPAGAVGAKTLRAFVDSYCQTAESSDTNNQITKAYTVVP